jgi:cytochrome c oxidase subunit 2
VINDTFTLLPEQASTMAPKVDALFWFITAVCVFSTLLIALMLVFFAIVYRRRDNDYIPPNIHGSKVLEVTWSVIPLGLTMVMFVWGVIVYFDIIRPPQDSMEIYVIGKQWMWHLQHPTGEREINQLHVPAGRPVKLIMTSEDVIHDFYIPAFRVKMDAVPGKYTNLWFQATKPGTYHLFCAMYCGTEHSRMIGTVTVMEQGEYEEWLTKKGDLSLAKQGRQLFQKLQCVTCHHPEANNRAPILEEIFGKQVLLEDGRSVRADEQYIRESILYPSRKVRAGWQSIMPSYSGQVSEDELIKVIEYIKGLKRGQTPSRIEYSEAPAQTPPAKDAAKTDPEKEKKKEPEAKPSEKKEPEKKEPEKKTPEKK